MRPSRPLRHAALQSGLQTDYIGSTDTRDLPHSGYRWPDALLQLVPTKEVEIRKTFGVDIDSGSGLCGEERLCRISPGLPLRSAKPRVSGGFKYNRRVMIQGYHGTGKSTHIEQVAARLNWPLIRINLDSHVSRIDLVGKDAIVLKDGKQITEFREGILPWALQRPIALVFDEYDAGRPDVMFVIQRILEASGQLTLLDQNRVMKPHPNFRLFSTTNTVGLGDTTGLYHGTQQLWVMMGDARTLEHDAKWTSSHQVPSGQGHLQGARGDMTRCVHRRRHLGDEPAR
jgi:cobaltochelatase CobS